jgi:DNA replication protein DnaC
VSGQPLDTRLRRLRLAYMAQAVEAQNADSLHHKHSYLEFLEALVDGEISTRENKALMKRIKAARFPVPKTLEEFDFDFQPKLDVKLVKALASCDFIEKKENVIFVGQPGTGKSHLSVALGVNACAAGYRVRFTTIQELAATLRASMADQTTEARIAELTEPDLLILDELGFTPLDRLLADAFYRVIASRYERASTIVTSYKSFESWAEVFPDPVIASAVLDRLVHHAHLVPIVGESFRMKNLKKPRKGGKSAAAA